MGFYDEMAGVALELLMPDDAGGLGQGTITLVRYGPAPTPTNSWDAPQPGARIETPLNGAARGVSRELIGSTVPNGGQIVSTDLMVIVAPFAGGYDPADIVEIDGAPVTILSVSNIPAAGTVCAVRFIVRR